MRVSGTFYVTDFAGLAVDVSLTEDGRVTVCSLSDNDVPSFAHDETQALIDVLTFCRDMGDRYAVEEDS